MKTISKILIAGIAVLGLGLSSFPSQAQTVYRTTYVTRVVHNPGYYYDNYSYRTCGCDTCGSCCSTCSTCNSCDTCNTCGYRGYTFWPFW